MLKGILVIDRNVIFRRGLSDTISDAIPDISVYEATSMGQAVNTIRSVDDISLVLLDIFLLDILLLGGDGRLLIYKLREINSNVKIVVTSELDDFLIIQSALDSGADGFISKSSEPLGMMEDISRYLNDENDFKISSSVVYDCIENSVNANTSNLNTPSANNARREGNDNLKELFSDKQYKIALLLMEGLTNKQIADRTFLSEGTVKNYVSRIYDKISVPNRAQAIVKLNNSM